MSLYLEPISDALKVGDELTFRVGLADAAIVDPVYSEQMTLKIVDVEKEQKKEGKKKPEGAGSGEKKIGDGARKPTRGLPPFKLLTRDGRQINGHDTDEWPDGFTEYDGGDVSALGDQNFMYKINYDNTYHLKYRPQRARSGGEGRCHREVHSRYEDRHARVRACASREAERRRL
ncbi:MAG: hypothetical protein WDN31_00985 [Hyphomicrobium sp.]